jgi:uncharacterized protein YciI
VAGPPPILYVLRHEPGPEWVDGVDFREQPGVEAHVGYLRSLLEQQVLVIGGPFLDGSGGMAVIRAATLDAAETIAFEDPTIGKLLFVTVRSWRPSMSSLDFPE